MDAPQQDLRFTSHLRRLALVKWGLVAVLAGNFGAWVLLVKLVGAMTSKTPVW